MKKSILLIGVLCFLLTSCGGGQKKATEQTTQEKPKTEQKCEKECQLTEEQKAEMDAFMAQWNNWDNLDDATKTDLIAKAKTCMDKKAEGCKGHDGEKEGCKSKETGEPCKGKEEGKPCCKEGDAPKCELTEEQKAEMEVKMAEMKAKWDSFETLSLNEQKELIDMKMNCCKKSCSGHHHGDKEGCKGHNHDGEKSCDKDKKADK
ncbi:MAG: hypothetical protein LBP67_01360 [Bacteroidales bacterium]|jgi:hypothetical protein|nr:hypothetical protein [Bacteroidales bacterium]